MSIDAGDAMKGAEDGVLSDQAVSAALATLAALRAEGTHLHDPVRFRYLEAMARRMQAQPASVRQVLAGRFHEAVAGYRQRHAGHGHDAGLPARTSLSPLARLNRDIAARTHASAAPALPGEAIASGPPQMQSVRRFADVWSKIATERQLTQALTRGPESAGPLNSHNLMLRAMSLMHGLSPDYLRRFLAQAEAMLWLEHMNQQSALKGPAAKEGKGVKDGKPARRTRARK